MSEVPLYTQSRRRGDQVALDAEGASREEPAILGSSV
jgi:hypothetical protein